MAEQQPSRRADVTLQVIDAIHATRVAAMLDLRLVAAKLTKREGAGLLGARAAGDVFRNLMFEVKLQLVLEIGFDAAAPDERAQPHADRVEETPRIHLTPPAA